MTTESVSARSTLELIRLFEIGLYQPTPEAEALVEEGIEIGDLSPDLRQIVEENPADFQEGDLDRIDTEGEARRLIASAIGTDMPGLQEHPGVQALQDLDSAELLQLLIDWIRNDGHERMQGEQQHGAPSGSGHPIGELDSGAQFSNGPQPVSWNPPHGGGGGHAPSGGGHAPSGGGHAPPAIASQTAPGVPPDVDQLDVQPGQNGVPPGLRPNAARGAQLVRDVFGFEGEIGGIGHRAGKSDHPDGNAIDVMTNSDMQLGQEIADYFVQNREELGVKYVIFNQRIASERTGWQWSLMEDRGSDTQNHLDHPHISFY